MSQRTPNVPRTRDSFFHRKYRDISNCPPTPATPKVTANQYQQYIRSATASSKLINTTPTTINSSSGRRSKKIKRDQNQSITSDYSTPRTIRTPNSGRQRGKQKVAYLKYMPLELETESSSESFESNFRRRKIKSTTPNSVTIPLAIEGPQKSSPIPDVGPSQSSYPVNNNGSPKVDETPKQAAELTTNNSTIPNFGSSDISPIDEDALAEPPLVKETLNDSMDTDEVQVIGYKPAPSANKQVQVVPSETNTVTISTSNSSNNNNEASSALPPNVATDSVVSSEPPTPPITPEKVKGDTSTFVPGNIWIFKQSQERNSVLSTQAT